MRGERISEVGRSVPMGVQSVATAWRVAGCAVGTLALIGLHYTSSVADVEVSPFTLLSVQGERFESRVQLAGKVAIISFWRLDQEYSIKILRDLSAIHRDFAAQGVKVVSIISGEVDRQRVRGIVKQLGLEFPVLLDPDRSVYAALDVFVCPSSRFFDTEGRRRFDYPGYRRDFPEAARTNIEFLLGNISAEEHKRQLTRKRLPAPRSAVGAPVRHGLADTSVREGKREAAKQQLR